MKIRMLILLWKIKKQHAENTKLQHFFNKYDWTIPLHYAIAHGIFKLAQCIIDAGYNVNIQDEEGTIPIILAVSHPKNVSIKIVKILLEAGANIFITNNNNQSAIKIVFNQTKDTKIEIVDLFLYEVKHFCSNNFEKAKILDDAGCALEYIIRMGDPEFTKYCLAKFNYAVNARNPFNNRTALHAAVERMDLTHIKLLVEYGADVNAKDSKNLVPLSLYSCVAETTDENLEIIRFLLDKGTVLNEPNRDEYYTDVPLAPLFLYGKKEVIRLLLEYNADLSIPTNNYKCTPLHRVSCNKNPGVIKELKDTNFKVDILDYYGYTPLMYAMRACNMSAIKLLLKKGANVNDMTSPWSPLVLPMWPCNYVDYRPKRKTRARYEACAEILLQHAATLDIDPLFKLIPLKRISSIFDDEGKHIYQHLRRPILAYLAKFEVLNRPINGKFREKINSYPIWKRRLTLYKRELEKMKEIKIYRSLDMFTLINDHEMKFIQRYHCHSKIVSKLRNANKNLPNSYLYRQLKKRINKAIEMLKVRVIAAAFISKVLNLPNNGHIITQNVLNYLRYSDHKKIVRTYCMLK